jgi:hypothetical protein
VKERTFKKTRVQVSELEYHEKWERTSFTENQQKVLDACNYPLTLKSLYKRFENDIPAPSIRRIVKTMEREHYMSKVKNDKWKTVK